jgi:hypothetical protein
MCCAASTFQSSRRSTLMFLLDGSEELESLCNASSIFCIGFGAVCPGRNTGIAVIMPRADTQAMQKHIDEISRAVAPGAHALIILDKAA